MTTRVDGINYADQPLPGEFVGSLITVLCDTSTQEGVTMFALSMGNSVLCCYPGKPFMRQYNLNIAGNDYGPILQYIGGIVKRHRDGGGNVTSVKYFLFDPQHLGKSLMEVMEGGVHLMIRRPKNSASMLKGSTQTSYNPHRTANMEPDTKDSDDLLGLLGITGVPSTVGHGPDPEEPVVPPARGSSPTDHAPHRSAAKPLRSPEAYLQALRRK